LPAFSATELHNRHRYRHARLIERVYHLATLRPCMHNPASVAVQLKLAECENAPAAALGPYRNLALLALFYGRA